MLDFSPTDFRYEKKFIITKSQFEVLKQRLSSILELDKNVPPCGFYFIRSIYFDDYRNTAYKSVLDGTSERQKYRIRYYNLDDSLIKLERKYKRNSMTQKDTCTITRDCFSNIMRKSVFIEAGNHQLLNKFYYYILYGGYNPVSIVDYNRIPYIYKASNTRITFDYNMQCSCEFHDLFGTNGLSIPLVKHNTVILEVKYNDFIPEFIRKTLQINAIEQTSFSKYALSRYLINKIYK